MRMIELCAGVGSMSFVWTHVLGQELAGQVEIDPYCRALLAQHWPDVKRMADIREVIGDEFGEDVDLVAAGFPCQPASVAGKRGGASDDRWLWPEVLRIARRIQPAWCLFENVPGLISMGLDGVLADLDAAGYEAWPLVLPAASVGAPHLRERVFIVAKPTVHGNHNVPGMSENSGTGLSTAVKTWPTPQARDHKGKSGPNHQFAETLSDVVGKVWHTPSAAAGQGGQRYVNGTTMAGIGPDGRKKQTTLGNDMQVLGERGALNPAWVEQLMGFPPGWTVLDGPLDRAKPSTTGKRRARSQARSRTERTA